MFEKEALIVITGSTGYIGTNLTKRLIENNLDFVTTKNLGNKKYNFLNHNGMVIEEDYFENKKLFLIHLATFFSKDEKDEKQITNSNELFGTKVIKQLSAFNLKKVIYTNTMYSFYNDPLIRNLHYTKSKNNFSIFLQKFSSINDFVLEEIFLDNTFGKLDPRPKIIPTILNSIVEKKENPIKNTNAVLNLVYIDDVVDRIIKGLDSTSSDSSCFISNKSLNLVSIYQFLLEFRNQREINTQILQFTKNTYTENHPEINLKNINLTDISYALTKELGEYENK